VHHLISEGKLLDIKIVDAINNKLPNYKNGDDQYNLNLVWGYYFGVLASLKRSESEILEEKEQFENSRPAILRLINKAREQEARNMPH
jgi:hypothetical protein